MGVANTKTQKTPANDTDNFVQRDSLSAPTSIVTKPEDNSVFNRLMN